MAWRYFPELMPIKPQPNILQLVPNACSSDAPIDLRMVITRYSHVMGSRSKFAALLHDLFPQRGFETNLILNAYDCGIAQRIAKESTLDGMLISTFTHQLERNFGLQTTYAYQAIEMWAQAYGILIEKPDNTSQKEQAAMNTPIASKGPASIQEEDLLETGWADRLGGIQEWPEDY